jgi:hypothetical protein
MDRDRDPPLPAGGPTDRAFAARTRPAGHAHHRRDGRRRPVVAPRRGHRPDRRRRDRRRSGLARRLGREQGGYARPRGRSIRLRRAVLRDGGGTRPRRPHRRRRGDRRPRSRRGARSARTPVGQPARDRRLVSGVRRDTTAAGDPHRHEPGYVRARARRRPLHRRPRGTRRAPRHSPAAATADAGRARAFHPFSNDSTGGPE